MSEALKLTGTQRKILREGIIGAYPNPDDLKILLSEQMDVQLGAIARGDAYNAKVFSLIQDFEADGRIEEFIRVVVVDKPNSPYLKTIKEFSGTLGEDNTEKQKHQYHPNENMDRRQLMTTLNELVPQQFNELIFEIKPPAGIIPPPPASQADRVYALLTWAESPSGIGLNRIQGALNAIINPK